MTTYFLWSYPTHATWEFDDGQSFWSYFEHRYKEFWEIWIWISGCANLTKDRDLHEGRFAYQRLKFCRSAIIAASRFQSLLVEMTSTFRDECGKHKIVHIDNYLHISDLRSWKDCSLGQALLIYTACNLGYSRTMFRNKCSSATIIAVSNCQSLLVHCQSSKTSAENTKCTHGQLFTL